jgi:hypothetical protein
MNFSKWLKMGFTLTVVSLCVVSSAFAGNQMRNQMQTKDPGLTVPAATLSDDEVADLAFQREEEKLARDVYLALYAKWGAAIFSNIAKSEQKHTDTLKKMLDKYGLPDPALPDIGAFTNPDLRARYVSLVADGLISHVDGLYVGATIEEIDMIDIQQALDATSRLDRRIICGPSSPRWRPRVSSTNRRSSAGSFTMPLSACKFIIVR